MLGLLAVGLPLLGAVDTAQADTFRVLVVQDFDRVTIEDRDDGAGEVPTMASSRKTTNTPGRVMIRPPSWVRDHSPLVEHVNCRYGSSWVADELPLLNGSTFDSDISKKFLEVLLEYFGRERLCVFRLEPEYLISPHSL